MCSTVLNIHKNAEGSHEVKTSCNDDLCVLCSVLVSFSNVHSFKTLETKHFKKPYAGASLVAQW